MNDYSKNKLIFVSKHNYERLRAISPDESFNKTISRLVDKVEQEQIKNI